MITYILYIFLGILFYFYLNFKEGLLIPFSIDTINRCKKDKCMTDFKLGRDECDVKNDCDYQCFATITNYSKEKSIDYTMDLENTIDNYIKCNNIEDTLFWPLFYDFSTLSNRNLNTIISKESLSREDFKTHGYIDPMDYPITNPSQTLDKLVEIFSQINPNFSRLVNFVVVKNDNPLDYNWHMIIFARSADSIYLLDPKHRVILKNNDIYNHPWFDITFSADEIPMANPDIEERVIDSLNWSKESSFFWTRKYHVERIQKTIYFLPLLNLESMINPQNSKYKLPNKNDINPNWESEKEQIRELLVEGNPILTKKEDTSYTLWIRRNPDNIIIDPRYRYVISSDSYAITSDDFNSEDFIDVGNSEYSLYKGLLVYNKEFDSRLELEASRRALEGEISEKNKYYRYNKNDLLINILNSTDIQEVDIETNTRGGKISSTIIRKDNSTDDPAVCLSIRSHELKSYVDNLEEIES